MTDKIEGYDPAEELLRTGKTGWMLKDRETLSGAIAAVYGELDPEDCARIDREWARMRGYILPTDGTSTLSPQDGCILCANGNDLPDGEHCRGCGREGTATGLRAAVIKARGRQEPPTVPVAFADGWRDGAPSKPWSLEWFIAETTYGDRVVLVALPDEWSHDFKTADDTYLKRDLIKRWMRFPDSQFIAPALPRAEGGAK